MQVDVDIGGFDWESEGRAGSRQVLRDPRCMQTTDEQNTKVSSEVLCLFWREFDLAGPF